MMCASVAITATRPAESVLHSPLELMQSDLGHVVMLAGISMTIGYVSLLKAWEMVPSTVIVPCLQLCSPMVEILEAALASDHAFHPVLAPLRGTRLTARTCAAFL